MMGERMFQRLDGNQMKLIAAASMLVDHGALLLIKYGILMGPLPGEAAYLRWKNLHYMMCSIGRIAFPIFAFLLVEGHLHTRNWKKYALRLAALAVISEIPFDCVTHGRWGLDWGMQNTIWTLLIGLLMLRGLVFAQAKQNPFLQLAVAALACAGAAALRTDYGYVGVMLILIFYFFRGQRVKQCLAGGLWMILMIGGGRYAAGYIAAFLLLFLYDESSKRTRWRWIWYIFYPFHLVFLWAVFLVWKGIM